MDLFNIFDVIVDVPISESSDEEENELLVTYARRLRNPKNFWERRNYFQEFNDVEFFQRFRLQKETCMKLLIEIESSIKSVTDRNTAVSPTTKLFLTLRFFATGSMLIVVGDFAGVSKASACVSVYEVSLAIAKLLLKYGEMSTTVQDINWVIEKFYEVARFPCVVGVIDCTHIRLQSSRGDNAEHFRNRKGYFSWNVQVVCDAELYIRNIVVRWPGSTHDSHIFNASRIKNTLENGNLGNNVFLGDSGYANINFLLTPLCDTMTAPQRLYNESHIRTRNAIEHCFGVWQMKFPVLSTGMRVSLQKSLTIVIATAVLHNIAIAERNGLPMDELEYVESDNSNGAEVNESHPENNIYILKD